MAEPKPIRLGWMAYEEVAIGIINQSPVYVFKKPDWMSQEEFENIAKELEKEAKNERIAEAPSGDTGPSKILEPKR